jgi:hypothetical protein
MALEQVFECPSTLAKLRSAPLGKLLDCFCKWLLDHGFSRGTTRLHLGNLSHLNEHLRCPRSRMRQTVAAGEIEGFFGKYACRCRNRGPLEEHLRRVRYSVNRFANYLREEGHYVATTSRAVYEPLLAGYLQWMSSYQHAAPGTLGVRAHSLIRFFQSLGQDATPRGLAKLDCEKVEQFVLAYASGNGRSARRSFSRLAVMTRSTGQIELAGSRRDSLAVKRRINTVTKSIWFLRHGVMDGILEEPDAEDRATVGTDPSAAPGLGEE